MKAKYGDKIKLVKKVCYGTFNGLVEFDVDTIFNVFNRNDSDDGIIAFEEITLKNEYGIKSHKVNVWDSEYVIL